MYIPVNRRKIRAAKKLHFWKRRNTSLDTPRLCVFRSSSHIQAQIVDDIKRQVIVTASSMESELKKSDATGMAMAEKIGGLVAERAIEKGIKKIVFDRNGFLYHGRIKALADSARQGGLDF